MIQIDFPEAPKISDRQDRQDEFERWYEQFKNCIIRQAEELAEAVDSKQNKS